MIVGMRSWQIGCLLGLALGLLQAIAGVLGLTSLPVGEGIARLLSTMIGTAALLGILGHVVTLRASGEPRSSTSTQHEHQR